MTENNLPAKLTETYADRRKMLKEMSKIYGVDTMVLLGMLHEARDTMHNDLANMGWLPENAPPMEWWPIRDLWKLAKEKYQEVLRRLAKYE